MSLGLIELLQRIRNATERNAGRPPRTRDFMTKGDMFRLLHLKRRGNVRTYPEVDGLMRVVIL
jgi:hypothetical protein